MLGVDARDLLMAGLDIMNGHCVVCCASHQIFGPYPMLAAVVAMERRCCVGVHWMGQNTPLLESFEWTELNVM